MFCANFINFTVQYVFLFWGKPKVYFSRFCCYQQRWWRIFYTFVIDRNKPEKKRRKKSGGGKGEHCKNTQKGWELQTPRMALHSKWNRTALNYSLLFLVWSDRMIECFCTKIRALKTRIWWDCKMVCHFGKTVWWLVKMQNIVTLLLNNSTLRNISSNYWKCAPMKHVHEGLQQCVANSKKVKTTQIAIKYWREIKCGLFIQ